MRKLILFYMMFFIYSDSLATVRYSENFNALPDWTIAQPTGSDESCYDFYGVDCGLIPGTFNGFYNGASFLNGITGFPGNNNLYINTSPGYPTETGNTSYGGSGKSLTHWQESQTEFRNDDGQLAVLLGAEYTELNVRFYIRFKPGFELKDPAGGQGFIMKLFHIQHYEDGSPHAYFGTNTGNQPVVSGGLDQYSSNISVVMETRCFETYECNNQVRFPLSSITNARLAGGIFDGDWHCIEFGAKTNTVVGASDGVVRAWFDGVELNYEDGYAGNDIIFNDKVGDPVRGFKYVTIGGNSYNQWDTSCSDMADCEQWYAIDSVAVGDGPIGLAGPVYDAPIVEILTESQSTTSETITIIGTLTTDSSLTGAGVDVDGVAATADDGTFDEPVEAWTALGVALSLGANTITATGTDSELTTDTDTISITRTAPATVHNVVSHGSLRLHNLILH